MKSFVDASVIVAILKREPGFEELIKQMTQAGSRLYVSPMVRFEAVAALVKLEVDHLQMRTGKFSPSDRTGFIDIARKIVDAFIVEIEAREIIVDASVGRGALDAMSAYGRMAGHPAALNFGECFSYAAAKANRLKLLYKGNDFAEIDLA